MSNSAISIIGYDLLGDNGEDGLRFAWKAKNSKTYIESAAFAQRRKGSSDNICGYTTSVSSGCVLQAMKAQCAFCRTGNRIPFGGPLSFIDSAKQNLSSVAACPRWRKALLRNGLLQIRRKVVYSPTSASQKCRYSLSFTPFNRCRLRRSFSAFVSS